MTLVKADLGIKRICPSCSARFYDLQKRPIECPKCAVTFEPESLYKQRRPRQPEPEKAVVATRERDEEEEVEEVEELEATEDEAVADETAPLEAAEDEEEVVAEEEPESPGMSVVEPDAESAEIEDIVEEDIVEEDAGHSALLEDVEEEEDDVSNIIDADLDKDER